eukprot:s4668_g1.t1
MHPLSGHLFHPKCNALNFEPRKGAKVRNQCVGDPFERFDPFNVRLVSLAVQGTQPPADDTCSLGTKKTCFTMKYLHLSYLRILRAKTSSGQEAAVRLLADPDHPLQFWQDHSLRDNLLHAIQGFAIAKNEPDKVIEFNLGYPAKSMVNLPGASSHVHVFESPTSVAAVCCDGNFGVHRALLSGVDPPRPKTAVVVLFVFAMPYSAVSVSGHMSCKGGRKHLGTCFKKGYDGPYNLQTQLANIKRSVGLGSSSWSDEAEEALKTWLRRLKMSSASSSIPGDRDTVPSLKRKMLMMNQTIEDLEGVVSRAQRDAEKHEDTLTEFKKLKAVLKEKGLEHLYENLS